MKKHTLENTIYTHGKGVSHVDKLDDTHQISTTWVFNRELEKTELHQCRELMKEHCISHNLQYISVDEHHVKIIGSSKNHTDAFDVDMHTYHKDGHTFHATHSPVKIPSELADKVHGVLGFNTHKIAHPYVWSSSIKPRASTTFTPLQLATMYNFPKNLDGTGQRVGIIELGGGYVLSDITHYFSMLGITATPNITAVSVDGARNNPADTSGANVEVILDIEVVAAIAPKASIFVYFAPNSDQGFYDAINAAINNNCGIISISWGAPEVYWNTTTMTTYNSLFSSAATKNVTILAASGDNGSSDGASGNNVDFPASSPYVLGCAGTTLTTTDNINIATETVWNSTGGGVSSLFTTPSYQSNLPQQTLTLLNGRRGVPDICGDGNPNTGYILYSASNGGTIVVGGTSAVSPLWSGLLALINQTVGHNVGFIHPTLYTNMANCRDITQGSNGAYAAGLGWDACTGCGSPNGQLLLNLLAGNAKPVSAFTGSPLSGVDRLTVAFTDNSTGVPTSWLWDFGDSTTSTSQNPSHTYTTVGTFTVSLTTTNTNGSNTLTKSNYITVGNAVKPVAAFSGTPLSGNASLTVKFTDSSLNTPTSWLWNFGDNTTSTSQNPSHVYSNAGTYTVSLTATNSAGSNMITKTNYITVTKVLTPVASFTASPTSGSRILTVQFTDTSTNNPTKWSWNFGDGNLSTVRNPSHRYNRRGSYTVILTASNSAGSNTVIKSNLIRVI